MPAARVLVLFAFQAYRAAQRFRRYDESEFRSLAEVRRDASVFQSRARESVQLLERLLLAEFHGVQDSNEGGWDTDAGRAAAAKPEEP